MLFHHKHLWLSYWEGFIGIIIVILDSVFGMLLSPKKICFFQTEKHCRHERPFVYSVRRHLFMSMYMQAGNIKLFIKKHKKMMQTVNEIEIRWSQSGCQNQKEERKRTKKRKERRKKQKIKLSYYFFSESNLWKRKKEKKRK